jgi:hypothetical protein
MPSISFDNIFGSQKIVKSSSSSMLTSKVENRKVLNDVDNDFLHPSSWISLETLIAKAPPLFYRAIMAKTITTTQNKFNNIILKFVILPLKH